MAKTTKMTVCGAPSSRTIGQHAEIRKGDPSSPPETHSRLRYRPTARPTVLPGAVRSTASATGDRPEPALPEIDLHAPGLAEDLGQSSRACRGAGDPSERAGPEPSHNRAPGTHRRGIPGRHGRGAIPIEGHGHRRLQSRQASRTPSRTGSEASRPATERRQSERPECSR
jgi:hypothetical protein